ncbi:cryptochrome/photolyase family protein [Constantimarinum furrinae]|uniref:Deoxyribodipyrimidine photolyase n=1 Tax=Constantimarinum furrinae TaxID=2562285 RepID=A0A7G8PW65_9FLAO|nr:deoxyribodipyrimidine photo-lyase [Constantimarinum furrinae]QNJ98581.1 Deoxyribodipyrimidine photolyase [Constantimarinum furrinae]
MEINIFWFRRDLRLDDNVGFTNALKGTYPVLPVFIFDNEILTELTKDDARVTFIFESVQKMRKELQEHQSSIAVYFGKPIEIFRQLTSEYTLKNVITNRDYEPYAKQRDKEVKELLAKKDIGFYTYKDQVIFEKDEVVKDNGEPYVVYTPYMKKWKEKFDESKHLEKVSYRQWQNLIQNTRLPNVTLRDIGFERSKIKVPDFDISADLLASYKQHRNFPSEDATSRIGPHLRFGTVSIRELVTLALKATDKTYLNELIWREFFMQILWHFPKTTHNAFKEKYDRIQWRNNKEEFKAWKNGKTGYPMVDAGMRQLNDTGYMHNRVRMVVAGFLCKHLLIDWRWGEAYFAEKLLDYELASNVGNWQWAAGSGVDAAPYFRIFNPITQLKKFDKDNEYVKKWISELNASNYPQPIVDHKEARERALKVYKRAVSE